MLTKSLILLAATLALGGLVATACGGAGVGADRVPVTIGDGEAVAQADDSSVLVELPGDPVTMADVNQQVGDQLAQLDFQYRSQRHQVVREAAERLLRERLLEMEAERRGVTRDELVDSLLEGELTVTDEEVAAFYEQNRQQLMPRTLEQLGPQIRQYLQQQRVERIVSEHTGELAEKEGVVWHLEPFRVEVADAEAPATGPAAAPVTLVEFSDFQCPYCRSFNDTLERVKADYQGRVRLVFRHFPLDQIHPQARKAAEAAMCAGEQEQFWQMHDLLFAEQSSLQLAGLQDKADRLGLDRAAFDACLESGRWADAIEQDRKAGVAAGVSGTPALFVNGRPVAGGAVPFDVVAEVIEEELTRAGRD